MILPAFSLILLILASTLGRWSSALVESASISGKCPPVNAAIAFCGSSTKMVLTSKPLLLNKFICTCNVSPRHPLVWLLKGELIVNSRGLATDTKKVCFMIYITSVTITCIFCCSLRPTSTLEFQLTFLLVVLPLTISTGVP